MITAGEVVALDTMCFIYAFEADRAFLPIVKPILAQIEVGAVSGTASVLVLTETLVGALGRGDATVAARYRQVFRDFPHLDLVPITVEVADLAAELRARHRLRTPDALHLACAIVSAADCFVTGDARLARVDEIEVRVLRAETGRP